MSAGFREGTQMARDNCHLLTSYLCISTSEKFASRLFSLGENRDSMLGKRQCAFGHRDIACPSNVSRSTVFSNFHWLSQWSSPFPFRLCSQCSSRWVKTNTRELNDEKRDGRSHRDSLLVEIYYYVGTYTRSISPRTAKQTETYVLIAERI